MEPSHYASVKEELAEVPPGFVGNPMVAPRCQLRSLFAKQCPADTAVGYIVVAAPGGGRVVAGKPVVYSESSKPYLELWSSLIYNLEPAPGFPAQFGLNLQGFPYVLDAKLRSDGDYGVTVDDSAIAEPLLGSRLTFCENGAKVDTLETTLKYSCQPAPAETKPFNSNPTQCPSTPSEKEATRWTLLANSWEEPAHYASNKAYPNADVEGVTGCNLLQFNPGIEFKPRGSYEGGTTQADEPTGVSFTLRVPQETSSNATPQLKALVMKLPAELTPSASAADGLEGCSNAQFGLGTEFGPGSRHSEPAKPASCPQASQIGTFEVFTPLLSGAPKIAGKLEAGQSLTCTPGNWSDSANFRFTWLRDGTEIPKASSEIPGAQSAQYTLTSDDEGQGPGDAGLDEAEGRRVIGFDDFRRRHEHHDGEGYQDHDDRLELALQVGQCAFLRARTCARHQGYEDHRRKRTRNERAGHGSGTPGHCDCSDPDSAVPAAEHRDAGRDSLGRKHAHMLQRRVEG